ncbi:hypothetical protein PG984_000074 [Apiospora sp. TS-2023a]
MDGHIRSSGDGSLLSSHSTSEYAESDMRGLVSEKQVRPSHRWSSKPRRAVRDPWVGIPYIIALASLCLAAYSNYQLRAQLRTPLRTPLRETVGLPYSPANHLIQYERRPFVLGFGDNLTEYVAKPSPELDAKWDDLYSSK